MKFSLVEPNPAVMSLIAPTEKSWTSSSSATMVQHGRRRALPWHLIDVLGTHRTGLGKNSMNLRNPKITFELELVWSDFCSMFPPSFSAPSGAWPPTATRCLPKRSFFSPQLSASSCQKTASWLHRLHHHGWCQCSWSSNIFVLIDSHGLKRRQLSTIIKWHFVCSTGLVFFSTFKDVGGISKWMFSDCLIAWVFRLSRLQGKCKQLSWAWLHKVMCGPLAFPWSTPHRRSPSLFSHISGLMLLPSSR